MAGIGLASLAFRYRYHLAPLAAGTALALEAGIGHLVNSGGWMWGALPALAAAGLLALTRDRGEERLYALGIGLGAGAWGAVAWSIGPRPILLAVLAVAGGAAAVPWWRHHAVRGRIEVIGGTWKPWERERWAYTRKAIAEMKATYAEWPETAANAGVDRWQIIRMVADHHSDSFHVEMPKGAEFRTLVAARGRLETALDTDHQEISIEPERRARRAVIRRSRQSGSRPVLSWPEPTGDGFFDPITLGEFEDRTPFVLDIDPDQNPHILIAGDSGAGKTSLIIGLALEWGSRPDTFLWLFDAAKRGAGYAAIPNAFARRVFERRDIVPGLQALSRIAEARAAYLADMNLEQWPTRPSHPQIVAILDETAELLRERGALHEVLRLVRLGRQLGIALVLATQRASGEALGDSTELRGLMRLRIGLHVNEAPDSELAFGRGCLAHGWNVRDIPVGWAIPQSPEHLTPRKAQLRLVPKAAEVRAARNAALPPQPELDAASAAAERVAEDRAVVARREAPAAIEPARPAGPPRIASVEQQDDIEELLAELEQALRELGPTASLRALSMRICGDPNKKRSWVNDKGLPTLVAQGRVVGSTGDWRVVGLEVMVGVEGEAR